MPANSEATKNQDDPQLHALHFKHYQQLLEHLQQSVDEQRPLSEIRRLFMAVDALKNPLLNRAVR